MLTADDIQQLAGTLDTISTLTEQKFFAIGKSVEQAIQILAHLAAAFEALHGELQSDAVAQIRQDLAETAAEALRLAAAPGGEAEALERLARVSEAINSRIMAMRKIARDVDILAMNARLTAAGMGDAGSDFMGFAVEIRRSAELALAKLEQIGRELAGAGQQLQAAHSGILAFIERHGAALQAIPQRLAAASATLQEHDQRAAVATATLAARSADVQSQVASMIVALQLGDITRQRIEHMRDMALVMAPLASPSTAFNNEWQALTPDQRAPLLAIGCKLAAAQLRDTADELNREAERIADGLGRLATDARDIGHLGEQAYGAADQRHHGFIAELETNLHETEVMFEHLRVARGDTEGRITSVLAAAQRLAGHIDTLRWLEADIRIMGLNTTLKCGRLGALGRPLSVIAQELRDCGGRMGRQAEFALDDLEQLRALAGSFDVTGRDSGGGDDGNTTRTLTSSIEPLGRAGRALSGALARLDTDSAAASDLLLQAVRDFALRHEIGEALHRAAAAPGQVAEPGPADAAATERLLTRFAAGYTMAREREVQARIAGHGDAGSREPRPAEPDLADVLF